MSNFKFAQIYEQSKNDGFITKRHLPFPENPLLINILQKLKQNGSAGLIVGGYVRDSLINQTNKSNITPKDLDIECYNITLDALAEMLSQYGHVDLVGKSFGVLKLRTPDGQDYDFSAPRRDNKTGVGHKDFKITLDPTISPREAASRRDFTINSLAYDPITQDLYDYFGGVEDIRNKTLKATSHAFTEDLVRVLRGLQFSSRFGFKIEPETAKICQGMAKEITDWQTVPLEKLRELEKLFKTFTIVDGKKVRSYPGPIGPMPIDERNSQREMTPQEALKWSIPNERVFEEFTKLFLKGKDFHCMFDYLDQTGWNKFFPEISNLVGVPQEPEWHPEGEVHTHTAHVMEAASEIANREGMSNEEKLVLMTSALCHDFAKPSTTKQMMKDGKMRWTSHGHEIAGMPLAKDFLNTIGAPQKLTSQVMPLVGRHLEHIRYKGDQTLGMIRSLARDIAPASLEQLGNLIESDHSGRPPLPKGLPEQARAMLEEARREGVINGLPQPLITGKDIMPYFGNKGGPAIGEAVKAAQEAWFKGRYTTREEALAWLDNYLKSKASILKGDQILPYFGGKGNKHVGNIMNEAWTAQRENKFTDPQGADQWLQGYMLDWLTQNPQSTPAPPSETVVPVANDVRE